MPYTQCKTIASNWQTVLSRLVAEAEWLVQSSQRTRKMSVEQLVQTLVLGCLDPEKTSLRLWRSLDSKRTKGGGSVLHPQNLL